MVANFRKKRKEGFSFSSVWVPFLAIALILIVVSLILVDFNIYRKRKELISQINAYQKQIDSIEKNNQELKKEISNSDNIDYLEKIAYEQLGEQKPGETGVIFITPEPKQSDAPVQQDVWTGWFSQAWNWIKSRF
jgi:cell division protein FtsB